MAAPTTAAPVKKALANPEPSPHGPTLPTWALKQVGSDMGNTGRDADTLRTAALDPDRTPPVHRSIAGGGLLLRRFDVGRPDHLAPFLSLVRDEFAEIGGRTGKHLRRPGRQGAPSASSR